ncbi:MAG: amino acid ABC transporter substrate-binding protein [Desulfobacterales bacterium]
MAEIEPIRIGATVSLDGKFSEPSAMIQSGFKLWESQINEGGGILGRPVELVLYNDKGDEKLVRELYEKLITEDKVDLVFSPYGTTLTLAASEVSERYGYVMLACGASGEKIWERGYQNVFGMYALANRYFIGLLDLMARHGFESVAVLYENSPFTKEAAEGAKTWAERFGLTVPLYERYQSAETELPGLLEEIRGVDPDGIIFCAYPEDGYEFLNITMEKAYRPKVIGITIAPIHPDFYDRAGHMAADKVFGPSQWEPDERIPFPGTKKFVEDFKSFTGIMPTYHAGSAYASCQILEKAILYIRSIDHRQIRNFITSLDTVTVIGRFKVDHFGRQIGHNAILIQWQNGQKQIVYPSKMRTAPPEF